MRSIHDILSNSGDVDREVAEALYKELRKNLDLEQAMRVSNDHPYESEDQSGDWVIVEIELVEGDEASIYALDGGVLLQMYDGEEFLDPVDNIHALNQQVKRLR